MVGKIPARPVADLIAQEARDKVTDGTINGKCSKCGHCCTCLLPVSAGELKQIRMYVQRNGIKPFHHDDGDVNSLDLVCPFLTDHGCSIYPVRPAICKSFMCNMEESKMKANRERFHDKYNITNLWETVFMEFDHSFKIKEVDGKLMMCKSDPLGVCNDQRR